MGNPADRVQRLPNTLCMPVAMVNMWSCCCPANTDRPSTKKADPCEVGFLLLFFREVYGSHRLIPAWVELQAGGVKIRDVVKMPCIDVIDLG